ncbi:hypothetical protein GGI26_006124 [Coemansia sp. RSA 1358]|nr:hypothetical protein EDC05_005970 [Coemansia umbellata]KAJ2619066.1 hypothetical protein GGI26_006124 [Coemansia sp. RSA 1358]
MLRDVSSSCGIHIDDLSDRMLATLKGSLNKQTTLTNAPARMEGTVAISFWKTNNGNGAFRAQQSTNRLLYGEASTRKHKLLSDTANALADIASFATFVVVVWWFGWWLVKQWKRNMTVLQHITKAPDHSGGLGVNAETRIAIECLDSKKQLK